MLNVFVLNLTNNGHLTNLIEIDFSGCRNTWEEILSIQVLSRNSVFELFSVVVDNLDTRLITVPASTAVDLFLRYFHLDSSEVVQLVQFMFKIL